MKVSIDKDECTGCGLCADECPDVFELDENEDVAVVKVEEVPEDLEDSVRESADGCPVEAIKIED